MSSAGRGSRGWQIDGVFFINSRRECHQNICGGPLYPKTTPGSKAHSYKLMKLRVFGKYGEFTVVGLIGGIREINIGWLNKNPSKNMRGRRKRLMKESVWENMAKKPQYAIV
jgi:hypothetical protein